MKRISLMLVSILFLFGMVTSASAIYIEGEISEGTGLVGTDGWSDAIFSWDIWSPDDLGNDYFGSWKYVYTFTDDEGITKELSHLIIEVSPSFTLANRLDGTTEFEEEDLRTYVEGEQGNPGAPGDIYGIKWEQWEDSGADWWSIMIITDREPMDGSFYAKDGKFNDGADDVYAYNTGFDSEYVGADAGIFVPVPDTNGVPEPATVLLLGAGFLGLALLHRKRARTKA